jgi:Flp pilus assembly protein TadD
MPRGGVPGNKGGSGKEGNKGGSGKEGNKGCSGKEGNKGGGKEGNKGNKGASGKEGNKGGAPPGSANASSAEKKALLLFTAGEELHRHGDINGALKHYREAVKHDPQRGDALNNIACILIHRKEVGDLQNAGSHQEIRELLEKSVLSGYEPAKKNLNLHRVVGEHGDRDNFLPHENDFRQIFEHSKSVVDSLSVLPIDHIMHAQCLLACCTDENRQKNNELAEHHIRLAVAADPFSVDFNENLGAILMKQGKDDEAAVVFDAVLKLRPHEAYSLHMSKILSLKASCSR